MKVILSFVVIISSVTIAVAQSSEHTGRFVAYDKFAGLTDLKAPPVVQRLIFEISDAPGHKGKEVVKLVYFPKTHGSVGTTKWIEPDRLRYENEWKVKLHAPSKAEESECPFPDFFRTYKGNFSDNKRDLPILHFRSTQFEADMLFDFPHMRCMILESLERVDR
jgi:hypothetical protein